MQYKTILFDLDGTLTDSAPGILNSVRYGCRRIGIPVPDEATLRRFLGPPLIDSFHNLCGLNDADTDRAVAAFREYFPDKGLFENEVYPGIPALLADLHARGCQLVLATSKPAASWSILIWRSTLPLSAVRLWTRPAPTRPRSSPTRCTPSA